jgi:hypothetical protein
MNTRKRVIADPYLAAFLFLKLKVKPVPTSDSSGRVSFEFPDDEKTEGVIQEFYADAQLSAFNYSTAIKSVKSIIFAVKGRNHGIAAG